MVFSYKTALSMLLFSLVAAAGAAVPGFDDDGEEIKPWQEQDVQLPESPRPENLLPFSPSAATDNKFFVDAATLSVGEDGVVRYTLVVLTPQGGRNVSFEGMRCETKEHRLYASGRSDGSWSRARNSQWLRILDATSNRHYAALFQEYFCPGGVIMRNADEVRDALKRGGYPGFWLR